MAWHRPVAAMLRAHLTAAAAAADDGGVVVVIGATTAQRDLICEEMARQDPRCARPAELTAEVPAAERLEMYARATTGTTAAAARRQRRRRPSGSGEGEDDDDDPSRPIPLVAFVTTRILVVDMLAGRLAPAQIAGMLVLNAHRASETSGEGFAARLYRSGGVVVAAAATGVAATATADGAAAGSQQGPPGAVAAPGSGAAAGAEAAAPAAAPPPPPPPTTTQHLVQLPGNRRSWLRAVSDAPSIFLSGFGRAERCMCALRVRRLVLWPRFQTAVQAALDGGEGGEGEEDHGGGGGGGGGNPCPTRVVEWEDDPSDGQMLAHEAAAELVCALLRDLQRLARLDVPSLLQEPRGVAAARREAPTAAGGGGAAAAAADADMDFSAPTASEDHGGRRGGGGRSSAANNKFSSAAASWHSDPRSLPLHRALDRAARAQLEPGWQQLGWRARQAVRDLGAAQGCLRALHALDSVSFLRHAEALRVTEGRRAAWLFHDAAAVLFEAARRRVYRLRPLSAGAAAVEEYKGDEVVRIVDSNSDEDEEGRKKPAPKAKPSPPQRKRRVRGAGGGGGGGGKRRRGGAAGVPSSTGGGSAHAAPGAMEVVPVLEQPPKWGLLLSALELAQRQRRGEATDEDDEDDDGEKKEKKKKQGGGESRKAGRKPAAAKGTEVVELLSSSSDDDGDEDNEQQKEDGAGARTPGGGNNNTTTATAPLQEPILVFVRDAATARQLSEVLRLGPEATMQALWADYLRARLPRGGGRGTAGGATAASRRGGRDRGGREGGGGRGGRAAGNRHTDEELQRAADAEVEARMVMQTAARGAGLAPGEGPALARAAQEAAAKAAAAAKAKADEPENDAVVVEDDDDEDDDDEAQQQEVHEDAAAAAAARRQRRRQQASVRLAAAAPKEQEQQQEDAEQRRHALARLARLADGVVLATLDGGSANPQQQQQQSRAAAATGNVALDPPLPSDDPAAVLWRTRPGHVVFYDADLSAVRQVEVYAACRAAAAAAASAALTDAPQEKGRDDSEEEDEDGLGGKTPGGGAPAPPPPPPLPKTPVRVSLLWVAGSPDRDALDASQRRETAAFTSLIEAAQRVVVPLDVGETGAGGAGGALLPPLALPPPPPAIGGVSGGGGTIGAPPSSSSALVPLQPTAADPCFTVGLTHHHHQPSPADVYALNAAARVGGLRGAAIGSGSGGSGDAHAAHAHAQLSRSAASSAAAAALGLPALSAAAAARLPRRVVVDVREFRASLPCVLHQQGFLLQPATLEIGDYVLSPDICVERKSVPDLLASLASGRLYTQAEAMARHYRFPVLLIEFEADRAFGLARAAGGETGGGGGGGGALAAVVDDLDPRAPACRLALLLLHFPRLRLVWSRAVHSTGEVFLGLKRGRSEPDPATAAAAGAPLEGGGDNAGAAPSTTTTGPVAESVINQTAIDLLRRLPGVTDANFRALMTAAGSLAGLAAMDERALAAAMGSVRGARALHSFLHMPSAGALREDGVVGAEGLGGGGGGGE
jgi:DNA excision repair protein ERCC-4